MAFSDTQRQQLGAKLGSKHVKTRGANGATLSYVEGWHVIAEANRIFGFEGWDRRTLSTRCVWSGASGNQHAAAYVAHVRVRVRAGDVAVTREGSGSAEAYAATPGEAHEVALKSAETDATKRALATFGNPFGLALYDREQSGVRKPREAKSPPTTGPWTLRSSSGTPEATFEKPSDFSAALRKAMSSAPDIETLFAIWEQNVDAVRDINRALKQDKLTKSGVAPQLVAHLKRCAIALANAQPQDTNSAAAAVHQRVRDDTEGGKIDKSVLTFGEPKRIRCKEHLRHVASQPCVICGRLPSHAHHLRHAQAKGIGLKVSDEFTVPLCATHHREIHTTTREREWWLERKIDPIAIAAELWRESRGRQPVAAENDPADASSDAADAPVVSSEGAVGA